MALKLPSQQCYRAAMVLSGVGDSLGFFHGKWEFNFSGPEIHSQVAKLGGLCNISVKEPSFNVSDDTVMHLASGRALVRTSHLSNNEILSCFAEEYINCMDDMTDRAPGATCISSCHFLSDVRQTSDSKAFRIPFNPRGGGCGAAMRSMCIGLRYPNTDDVDQLITISIESGRMTHNNPTGYLGGLVSALFTSYAIQGKAVVEWGRQLVDHILPKAKVYIKTTGVDVDDNLNNWSYFETKWRDYLSLRKISSDIGGEPVFPEDYDVEARDKFYRSISYSGWGGASGHDAVIIAYDALLGCNGQWEELCNRAVLHGGDSDSTGTIACCWYGVLHGLQQVYPKNHEEVEYRDQMVELADKLHQMAFPNRS